ncbi:N utilization substance protein B [Devosia pacifica]|uniref:Transcription antitermination protein NusB n=1 Tax=Devosia pacifica TaxID=1335967 RepID=A0A918SDC0_9HYPH|nr:transcription antitermination factor NusB [Devosia pacifica]GHA36465.1 N utilization substance protein B [Devosia pacifica]
MSGPSKRDPESAPVANQRGVARLAAVQALYQMDVGRITLEETLSQFGMYRLGQDIEGDEYLPADEDYFRQIVRGVIKHQLDIDPAVNRSLDADWPVNRVDATIRAILRAATYEMLKRQDVPPRVVISEYVDITKAFHEDDAAGLVNASLDAIGRRANIF